MLNVIKFIYISLIYDLHIKIAVTLMNSKHVICAILTPLGHFKY